MHGKAGADRRRDRFIHNENLARARLMGRFLNGPAVDRCRAVRHADYQPPYGRAKKTSPYALADKLPEQMLGNVEVGDDAVLQWLDDSQFARRAAKHAVGFRTECDHAAGVPPAAAPNRHKGWFVEYDAPAAHVHERIGGAKIDREVCRQVVCESAGERNHCVPLIRERRARITRVQAIRGWRFLVVRASL